MITTTHAEAVALFAQVGGAQPIPGELWTAIGIVVAAIVAAIAATIGHFIGGRGKARADAGQLALEYATGLRADIAELRERVTTLETERNGYRSHALVLHEWGGHVETAERPRPDWPTHLPR